MTKLYEQELFTDFFSASDITKGDDAINFISFFSSSFPADSIGINIKTSK